LKSICSRANGDTAGRKGSGTCESDPSRSGVWGEAIRLGLRKGRAATGDSPVGPQRDRDSAVTHITAPCRLPAGLLLDLCWPLLYAVTSRPRQCPALTGACCCLQSCPRHLVDAGDFQAQSKPVSTTASALDRQPGVYSVACEYVRAYTVPALTLIRATEECLGRSAIPSRFWLAQLVQGPWRRSRKEKGGKGSPGKVETVPQPDWVGEHGSTGTRGTGLRRQQISGPIRMSHPGVVPGCSWAVPRSGVLLATSTTVRIPK
jgi:hypothetical protein